MHKEIIIHIGTEKTGTSTIQRFLCQNRKKLLSQGIIYPECAAKHGGSQWEFVACVAKNPWSREIDFSLNIQNEEDRELYKKQFLNNLNKELSEYKNSQKIIISSEHFHSRLTKEAEILELRNILEPYANRFKILLYLRRQDRMAISSYSTKIKSGQPQPEIFPDGSRKELSYYYDYFAVYSNWAAVFGHENIEVTVFERIAASEGGILKSFADSCGISLYEKIIPPQENESLSNDSAFILLAINKIIQKKGLTISSKLYTELVSLLASARGKKFYPCTKQDAIAFYKKFNNPNEALRKLALPSNPNSLFDEDFHDYPDVVEKEPNEGTAEIILSIWEKYFNLKETIPYFSQPENLISCIYQGILNRAPDPAGAKQWQDKLIEQKDLTGLIRTFINSPEFLKKFSSHNKALPPNTTE